MKSFLGFAALAAVLLTACAHQEPSAPQEDLSPEAEAKPMRFEDMDKGEFFPTGKLAYNIQGKMVSEEVTFTNILEGTEYTAQPNNSDVVLKGLIDELWRTPLSKVITTYTREDGSPLSEDDFPPDKWVTLRTLAGSGNFACFVPKEILLEVQTAWGDVLTANRPEVPHGDGDYLVCREGPNGTPDFSDVWIVNGAIFPLTYDMSRKP